MSDLSLDVFRNFLECQRLAEGSGRVADEADVREGRPQCAQGLRHLSHELVDIVGFLLADRFLVEGFSSSLAFGACNEFFGGARVHPRSEMAKDENTVSFFEERIHKAFFCKSAKCPPWHSWGEEDEVRLVAVLFGEEQFTF